MLSCPFPRPDEPELLSPITDLALTGESYSTRAEDDLYFTKSQVASLVRCYLRRTDCSVVVMDTETGKTPSRREVSKKKRPAGS
jgi:hypothetical protein